MPITIEKPYGTLTLDRSPYDVETIRRAIAYVERGYSYSRAGHAAGVPKGTVETWVRHLGGVRAVRRGRERKTVGFRERAMERLAAMERQGASYAEAVEAAMCVWAN
ncbi:MAG: hypothetical protein GVY12_16050 [Bacteroidetes bacterium]|jgi:transposase|nr:hypothetical protein [Bacteroidota bacterium]